MAAADLPLSAWCTVCVCCPALPEHRHGVCVRWGRDGCGGVLPLAGFVSALKQLVYLPPWSMCQVGGTNRCWLPSNLLFVLTSMPAASLACASPWSTCQVGRAAAD